MRIPPEDMLLSLEDFVKIKQVNVLTLFRFEPNPLAPPFRMSGT